MDCFTVNEKGIIVGRGIISEEKFDASRHVVVDEEETHLNFHIPKWENGQWVEGLSEDEARERDEQRFINGKAGLLRQAKNDAGNIIQSFFPIFKQVNAVREGTHKELFDWIDSVRVQSEEFEKQIMACESVDELLKIEIKYEPPAEE